LKNGLQIIGALTPEGIVAYLRRYPARDFTTVALGPKPLEVKN
jgi:hypothetical protein